MFELTTELPIGLSVLCLLLGAAYAFVLYQKHTFEAKPWLPKAMALLRFIVVSILAFFLLEPFLTTLIIDKEKPIVIVAMDNSESIVADSSFYQQTFLKELTNLKEELSGEHQVDFYTIGASCQQDGVVNFLDKKTDFSQALQQFSDVYAYRNVAAVVLASDGLYNSGKNPMYSVYPFEAPLYTIALGDTMPQKELEISLTAHNDLAFLGNNFPLEVSVQATFCKGENSKLTLWEGSRLLHEESFSVEKEQQLFHFNLSLKAEEVGVHQYTLRLEEIEGERNVENNSQSIFIEVLESRQKILLLSEYTHPDVAALSSAISQNDNYELDSKKLSEFDGNWSPYSLCIAFQTTLPEPTIPVWYLMGSNTASLTTEWLTFEKNKKDISEVFPDFQSFSLFTLSDDWEAWSRQLPPLLAPFGRYEVLAAHQPLFMQKERGIQTGLPLLSFSHDYERKSAVFAGEGLWRWRMFEYAQKQEHRLFDELINKIVQFLAVKEDKRLFRVKAPKKAWEQEELLISAELYNANYELVNNPEVSFKLIDEEGKEFDYVFNRNRESYHLSLSNLSSGLYSYKATVLHGEQLHQSVGRFNLMPLQLEQQSTQANHQLLYALSDSKEGDMYYSNELSELTKEIETLDSKTLSYSRTHLSELIYSKWIFFLLLVLLSLEWFLRKRNGSI